MCVPELVLNREVQMMNEVDFPSILKELQKHLATNIETSRGVVKIRESEQVPFGQRKPPDRIVEYDCHDIKVTVSNIAPMEPQWPAVVFTGIALVVNAKDNQDAIFKRWHESRLPKIDLKYAPQGRQSSRETIRNYFPHTNKEYFPLITDDERSHGYYLLPGQSITYEMDVLFAECLDFSDVDIRVEATLSRRHLFHFTKEFTA